MQKSAGISSGFVKYASVHALLVNIAHNPLCNGKGESETVLFPHFQLQKSGLECEDKTAIVVYKCMNL